MSLLQPVDRQVQDRLADLIPVCAILPVTDGGDGKDDSGIGVQGGNAVDDPVPLLHNLLNGQSFPNKAVGRELMAVGYHLAG
jgi:hypothetical protein